MRPKLAKMLQKYLEKAHGDMTLVQRFFNGTLKSSDPSRGKVRFQKILRASDDYYEQDYDGDEYGLEMPEDVDNVTNQDYDIDANEEM